MSSTDNRQHAVAHPHFDGGSGKTTMTYDAIVIGARCAGSPTAMLLARKGYRVLLVDKARFPSDTVSTHVIWQAGLASVSMPGAFPPVLVGTRFLIDAGMYDPVPVSVVKEMGADILIASALRGQNLAYAGATSMLDGKEHNQKKRAPRSPHIVDLLLGSYSIAMTTISTHSMREADAVIQPKLHRVPLYQFSGGHKFVAAGYEAVEEALPALQKQLPWLAT